MKGSGESDTHWRSVDETLERGRGGFKRFMIASNESSTDYYNTCALRCNTLSRHCVALSCLCTSLLLQRASKVRCRGQMWLQLITCGSSARQVRAHVCNCERMRGSVWACVCGGGGLTI